MVGVGISLALGLSFEMGKSEDKLRVGMIGIGLRGTNHLGNLLLRKDVLITDVFDIDPHRISIALDKIKKSR